MDRKISAMHKEYGKRHVGRCGDCCNLYRMIYNRKSYLKCAAYGASQSEATDWSEKYNACGIYNEPFILLKKRRLFDLLHPSRGEVVEVDGQIDIFEVHNVTD